jgi:hypothetical protein
MAKRKRQPKQTLPAGRGGTPVPASSDLLKIPCRGLQRAGEYDKIDKATRL